jgi:hypothetical protein
LQTDGARCRPTEQALCRTIEYRSQNQSSNVPKRMRLMGIWTRRTKNPMNPMTAKPIAVAVVIFMNSAHFPQRHDNKHKDKKSDLHFLDSKRYLKASRARAARSFRAM